MIHTVKSFIVIDETELDVFLEFSCFLYDPVNAGNLISGSSAFSKPSFNTWKLLVHVTLKPRMQNFKHDLTSMEMSAIVWWFEHSYMSLVAQKANRYLKQEF